MSIIFTAGLVVFSILVGLALGVSFSIWIVSKVLARQAKKAISFIEGLDKN